MAAIDDSHIAIIGAGIAGLACAEILQRAGRRVSVFDKSRGVGGRMSTRRGDDWQCDHGAQYFTARHPDFRAEINRWRQAGVADLWQPRLRVWDGALLPDTDSTVERFVGTPRMTAPAHWLIDNFLRDNPPKKNLTLHLQTTIQHLEWRTDGWYLFTVEHGWLPNRFDAVLLALPAPQVLPLLEHTASELASFARQAKMRACWALMLQYDTSLELPFDALFVNRGPLRWLARDTSKPARSGRETWLLHANADWSEQHLESEAANVATILLAAFAEIGGTAPQAWTAHRWRYANTEQMLVDGCGWSAANGVGICGDWLNGGKVEGAWLSGRELARRVLQSPFN
ncbi:MAG TPA: FAD-dependent oxidoreductase [Spongiibacteraceae bacterium]|nr:FAD-dependent oxidoreductase [Spongiibacteraceae bacterium]